MWAHVMLALSQFWHSTFMSGALPSTVMVAAVDFQAFRSFKNIHDAAEYQWGTALFRWGQAFIGGGLGVTIFRGVVGPN